MLLLRAGSQYWHNNRNKIEKQRTQFSNGKCVLLLFLFFWVAFGAIWVHFSPLFAFRAVYLQLAPKSEMKQKNKI